MTRAKNSFDTEFTWSLVTPPEAATVASFVNTAYRGELAKSGWTSEAHFIKGQRTDEQSIIDFLRQPNHWMLQLYQNSQRVAVVQLQETTIELPELADKAGTEELPSSESSLHSQIMSQIMLGMLTVHPTIQNRGFGKKLLEISESFAREKGYTQMLMTVITIRESLIAYYLRRGYQCSKKHSPFPYGQAQFGLPEREDLQFVYLFKNL